MSVLSLGLCPSTRPVESSQTKGHISSYVLNSSVRKEISSSGNDGSLTSTSIATSRSTSSNDPEQESLELDFDSEPVFQDSNPPASVSSNSNASSFAISVSQLSSVSDFSIQASKWLKLMTAKATEKKKPVNFDEGSDLTEEDYHVLTGLSKENFGKLAEYVKGGNL
ncbi:hypothetical protein FQR65_LT10586 [Abscondita terminalis]|nr:hypothetical protein FQR65_LT10586 [Abscondita terminalis]